jgi:hypothetical protein
MNAGKWTASLLKNSSFIILLSIIMGPAFPGPAKVTEWLITPRTPAWSLRASASARAASPCSLSASLRAAGCTGGLLQGPGIAGQHPGFLLEETPAIAGGGCGAWEMVLWHLFETYENATEL